MSFSIIGNSSNVTAAVTGGVFSFLRTLTATPTLSVSPAFILASYIIDNAIGVMTDPDDSLAWPLFISYIPDSDGVANNAGCIYDTPGFKDGRLMEGPVVLHYGIQLKIRSVDHITGWSKLEAIASALSTVDNNNIVIGADEFLINNIKQIGDIIPLGRELNTKSRMLFTINFLITLERVI